MNALARAKLEKAMIPYGGGISFSAGRFNRKDLRDAKRMGMRFGQKLKEKGRKFVGKDWERWKNLARRMRGKGKRKGGGGGGGKRPDVRRFYQDGKPVFYSG